MHSCFQDGCEIINCGALGQGGTALQLPMSLHMHVHFPCMTLLAIIPVCFVSAAQVHTACRSLETSALIFQALQECFWYLGTSDTDPPRLCSRQSVSSGTRLKPVRQSLRDSHLTQAVSRQAKAVCPSFAWPEDPEDAWTGSSTLKSTGTQFHSE